MKISISYPPLELISVLYFNLGIGNDYQYFGGGYTYFTVKILLNHERHETSRGDRPVAPTAFA